MHTFYTSIIIQPPHSADPYDMKGAIFISNVLKNVLYGKQLKVFTELKLCKKTRFPFTVTCSGILYKDNPEVKYTPT